MQVISDPYRVSCFLKGLPIKKEALFVASSFTDLPLDSLINLHIADSSYLSIKYTIRNISSSVNKKTGRASTPRLDPGGYSGHISYILFLLDNKTSFYNVNCNFT